MKRIITIAALGLCLTGCERRDAEAVVRADLKDPDSAKFGDFYYNSQTKKGCLTVNAKNEMGGYIGDQQAYVMKGPGGWEEHGLADISPLDCRTGFADVSPPPVKEMTPDELDRTAKDMEDQAKRASGQTTADDLDRMAEDAHNAADSASGDQP